MTPRQKSVANSFAIMLSLSSMLLASAALAADQMPEIVPAPDYGNASPEILAAVKHLGRPHWEIRRDAARKPAEVLTFSQIKPGMVVADLIPGDGYYSRMLTKLVGPAGKVWGVVPSTVNIRGARSLQRDGKAPAQVPKDHTEQCAIGCYPSGRPPAALDIDLVLAVENLREDYANFRAISESYDYGLSLPTQIDAAFTANGYHALHSNAVYAVPQAVPGRVNTRDPLDVVKFHKSVFYAMNPGGVYLVADYAAAKGAGFSQADALQRVDADAVKAEILQAGFVFDGESKVLANASDDHSKSADDVYGVRDGFDQFIFRFRKPANASGVTMRPTKPEEEARFGNYMDNTHVLRADNKALEPNGDRIRWHFYNRDHTFQEMGRVTDGVAPMQAGIWFWDAYGNHCLLREFPMDERGGSGCNDYYVHRDFNVLSDQYPGQNVPNNEKMTILPGHVHLK